MLSVPIIKPVAGTEIGRGGFEIRGIVPVIDGNGKYLGSVESLSSFIQINDSISNDKEYIAVYMKGIPSPCKPVAG